jgi:hypothetical protein
MINNQLSDALVPFLEPKTIYLTRDIPYKYKHLTVFKSALIKLIDPIVAKYPSQYGFSFCDYDKIPPQIKMKEFIRYHTPITLRPCVRKYWRRKNMGKDGYPYYFGKEYLDMIFPSNRLSVSKYIHIDKIDDPNMLSRVLSVELLITDRF